MLNVTHIFLSKGRKHCMKRRTCWLPAISSFLTEFSKRASLVGSLKTELGGKGVSLYQINEKSDPSKIKTFADDKVNIAELFSTQSRLLIPLRKRQFENIVGKGEKCW